MLFKMLIYLISLLAVIQGAKSQLVIDPTSCAHLRITLAAALDEMLDMANTAYIRTSNIWVPQTPAAELRVVHNLLNVFFVSNDPQKGETYARDLLCKSLSNQYLQAYCQLTKYRLLRHY